MHITIQLEKHHSTPTIAITYSKDRLQAVKLHQKQKTLRKYTNSLIRILGLYKYKQPSTLTGNM